jgi:hypothetical protein
MPNAHRNSDNVPLQTSGVSKNSLSFSGGSQAMRHAYRKLNESAALAQLLTA